MPEQTFVAHLSYLRANHWHVLDLETFLNGIEAPENLPARAVLLTFDDGYRSNLEMAVPWLLRFGYPAVVFVPTQFIGGTNRFDDGNEPEEAICDWDDLLRLERSGVSVQSHGVSHRPFSQLRPSEQEKEIAQSKESLESRLGRPVELFSYPYGDEGTNPGFLAQVLSRQGYRGACLYGGGHNVLPVANPYRLARVAMGPDTDLQAALGKES